MNYKLLSPPEVTLTIQEQQEIDKGLVNYGYEGESVYVVKHVNDEHSDTLLTVLSEDEEETLFHFDRDTLTTF